MVLGAFLSHVIPNGQTIARQGSDSVAQQTTVVLTVMALIGCNHVFQDLEKRPLRPHKNSSGVNSIITQLTFV